MKKSLAKLAFSQTEKGIMKLPTGKEWFTCTIGVQPTDWSVRIRYTEPIQLDGTVKAELDFMMPDAEYLLKKGTKFRLFGGYQLECDVEVLEELESK
jgi:hypothetical protein